MSREAIALAPLDRGFAGLIEAIHRAAMAPAWSGETLAQLLSQPSHYGVLAAIAGEPAGFVLARAVAGEAEILTLATLPGTRRRGVGRALVEAALDEGVARGAARMVLEVAVDNAAAIALYRGLGFVTVGRRKGYYAAPGGGAIDASIMAKELTSTARSESASNG